MRGYGQGNQARVFGSGILLIEVFRIRRRGGFMLIDCGSSDSTASVTFTSLASCKMQSILSCAPQRIRLNLLFRSLDVFAA